MLRPRRAVLLPSRRRRGAARRSSTGCAATTPLRDPPSSRPLQAYPFSLALQTRWKDNDQFGHVNNVNYYSFFDTAISSCLMHQLGFCPESAPALPFIVHSSCTFHQPLSYPDLAVTTMGVQKLGKSSVTYECAVFRRPSKATDAPVELAEQPLCAVGTMTHVFVDRATQRPVPMDGELRRAYEALLLPKTDADATAS